MIFATLQNYLKRLYLFPLLQNSVIRFQNKSFGSELKTHLFPDLFSFETQRCKSSLKKCAWSLKLYIFEKKVRLEFGTKWLHENHRVKESAPGVWNLHRWVFNSRWRTFLTRLKLSKYELHYHFLAAMHPVISLYQKVLILCHKWEPTHSWGVFWYHRLCCGFSTRIIIEYSIGVV